MVLTSRDVELWIFPLHPRRGDGDLLAPDEHRHAAAFHFDRDRERYIAGRAMLRRLLGAGLDRDPASLRFRYGSSGKPSLDGPLSFNFSNSEDLGALAIAAFDLGVDIERVRTIEEDVAGRFFAADEVARLRAQPIERQTEAFFNCWTRKEAYIKALGDGLLLQLDRFSVSLAPGEQPKLLRAGDDAAEPGRWCMHHFIPARGFVGAIAARQTGWRVRLHHFDPGYDPAVASFPAISSGQR